MVDDLIAKADRMGVNCMKLREVSTSHLSSRAFFGL